MALDLYIKPGCPYCTKVTRHLTEMNKTVDHLKDIRSNPAFRDELLKKGGKIQVPCLIHDGEVLYESDAIILWFEEHRNSLPDRPVNQ